MSYKSILVHVDLGDGAPSRIHCAALLARRCGAHLIGAAATGISRFVPPEVLAAGHNPLARRCRALRADALQALDRFSLLARQEDVPSFEARLIDDDVDGGLPLAARYCNLAVLGQPDRMLIDPLNPTDLPERVLLEGGHPALVMPGSRYSPRLDGEVVVAWDGSAGAMRAVAAALPLLRQARHATVLGIGTQLPATCLEHEACTALAAWLERHGVTADTCRRTRSDDPGMTILAAAVDADADLIVMGAYGHSRVREALTEGVTTTVLRWAHLPAFLSH